MVTSLDLSLEELNRRSEVASGMVVAPASSSSTTLKTTSKWNLEIVGKNFDDGSSELVSKSYATVARFEGTVLYFTKILSSAG
jgi:hypothetical protein